MNESKCTDEINSMDGCDHHAYGWIWSIWLVTFAYVVKFISYQRGWMVTYVWMFQPWHKFSPTYQFHPPLMKFWTQIKKFNLTLNLRGEFVYPGDFVNCLHGPPPIKTNLKNKKLLS
jgi:hypothetical protein